LLLAPWLVTARASQSHAHVPRNDPARIQSIVNELLAQLGIPNPVTVHIVAVNPLLASVEPHPEQPGTFQLFLEDAFVDELADDELEAVVAHELGHVWVFTHHPFLQTEQLANQVAMRVVGRDILQRVYAKVWAHSGSKGDLTQFLGN
jgi:hypothetical protein